MVLAGALGLETDLLHPDSPGAGRRFDPHHVTDTATQDRGSERRQHRKPIGVDVRLFRVD